MRVLFSAVPAGGHIFPLLPMAAAADAEGHDTAILTAAAMVGLAAPVRVIDAGADIETVLAETVNRVGPWKGPGVEAAEMFAGTRVDLSYPEAVERAWEFSPDLMICDVLDYVGPTIAAALQVPWASHGISGGLPPIFTTALADRWQRQLDRLCLVPTQRIAYFDPYPTLLLEHPRLEADRLPVRPVPFDRPGPRLRLPGFADPSLPTALVSLGTSITDLTVVHHFARDIAGEGVNVLVTHDAPEHDGTGRDEGDPRIHYLGFVPLARLVPHVDVILSTGGTGTVLAALAEGVPLVVHPMMADQFLNAARVAASGAGLVITDATASAPAVREVLEVLHTASYRARARQIGAELMQLPTPGEALQSLIAHTIPAHSI